MLKIKQKQKLFFSIFISLFLAGGFFWWARVYSSTDLDGDSYAGESSGGNDCVDSLSSVYKDNNDCDDTAAPAFLAAYEDPDGTNDIADHAWMKDDSGTWHLYFHWNSVASNTDIAHFITTDFKTITKVGNALDNDVNTYYDSIWAPHVIKNGSTYYMFFTGVERPGNPWTERIGLATSTDLTTWTMYPENNCSGTTGDGCIYECDNAWTTWGDGGIYDQQCRDPMVIRDETNNRWVMFATARYNVGDKAIVDVSYSNNLVDWTGAGYISATQGGQAENPFATEYNGTYYLTFTDWSDAEPPAMVQYATSTTLTADGSGSANWVYQGSIPDAGVNAIEVVKPYDDTWFMAESISNENSGDADHARELRIKRVLWQADGTFTLSKLSDLSCRVESSNINPGASEICSDGLDNNCSGEADESYWCTACTDSDGDGYGTASLGTCTYTGTDCNDSNNAIHPGAIEICDSLDNDCDGSIDEGGVCLCTESWSCGDWSTCTDSLQTRTCTDANNCGTTADRPITSQSCLMSVETSEKEAEDLPYLASPTVIFPKSEVTVNMAKPTITGLARSNNSIFIFIDSDLENVVLSTNHPSGTGSFFYKLRRNLSPGQHSVYTIARNADGVFSSRSPKIYFTVELPYIGPTLFEPVIDYRGSPGLIVRGVCHNNSLIRIYLDGRNYVQFPVIDKNLDTVYFSYKIPFKNLTTGQHRVWAQAFDFSGKASKISNTFDFYKSGYYLKILR